MDKSPRLCLARGGDKPKIPRRKDQPTLHQLVVKSAPQQARPETHAESRVDGGTNLLDTGTTRNFPRFELDDPSLTGFTSYLQGIDGGQKSFRRPL